MPELSAIEFRRHPRARRYTIRVNVDGSIRVTMPRWGSRREAGAFARREHSWIERQRRRIEEQRRRAPIVSGEAAASLREAAGRDLPRQLLDLAARHGLTVRGIRIRAQRGRWGSCSPAGVISLNWRLVQVPAFVREYVLVHELMHLRRHDHSPAFWRLVADAFPLYDDARKWLREHGHLLAD
jgi:predicted metal-dependent hydrolase